MSDEQVVEHLYNIARNWITQDPNRTTRKHVENLIETDNIIELGRLFPFRPPIRIGFGTAGLRATMKPGPCGMNDLVVIQSTQGLAKYCLQHNLGLGGNKGFRAVVGYDHRANEEYGLTSRNFAVLTKLVLEKAGIETTLLHGYVPTPLVAFSVKSTPECIVGVMVTASHNPKTDNGYKVYWSDGVQIRPPNDKHIANCILENIVPWIDYGAKLRSLNERKPDSDQLSDREDTVRLSKLYFQSLSNIGGLVTNQYEQARKKLSIDDLDVLPKFAYTAMHGVGHPFAIKCFQHFHLPPFYSTPSQQNPDPQFPTVIFPNPEEKGALNESMEYAETMGLDLVLANDPDADRLAVAEKDRISGTWTVFTGDQTAVLLGHWMWEQFGKHSSRPVAMCASTVSSKMLAAIARAEGFRFDDTLTGFKYISSHSEYLRSEAGGNHLVLFGYEEAIGYCCGDIVNDKDGISALGVFAELCVWVYSQKRMNMVQYLQSLCDIYGEFVTNNGYYYCHDPTVVFQIMAKLRNGGKYLSKVGLYTIQSIRDLGAYPYDSTTLDHKPTLPTSKTSPMITLTFTNGCITQIRASGTEPKLKYYIELPGKPGVSKKLVQEELDIMSDVLLEELLEPTKHGLVKVKP